MSSRKLYHWYRHFLSGYTQAKQDGIWGGNKIEVLNTQTGEIKEKPVYIAKPKNVGSVMALDEKKIGNGVFTILTNQLTGKIALMIEALKVEQLQDALKYLGDSIQRIETISRDMSPTYAKFCNESLSWVMQVIDKFHVMKYVYEALQEVRIRIKKDLEKGMVKGAKITEIDQNILSDLELLKRTRYLLNKRESIWNDDQREIMEELFDRFNELKKAYHIAHNFRKWYDKDNIRRKPKTMENRLENWYKEVESSNIEEFNSCVKMIKKHQNLIVNFFKDAVTNAKAENCNGKIQRFVTNNYGLKDKDFTLFRLDKYFS